MGRFLPSYCASFALFSCVFAASLGFTQSVNASVERYDYDALGRLIRVVDAEGQVTEYEYDPVGNILSVSRPGEAQPPSVSGVEPAIVRRQQQVLVSVSGSNFSGATVSSPSAGLPIGGLQVAPAEITFNLAPSASAPLGMQTFMINSAAGNVPFELRIDPVLPTMSILPGPIAVPPDGSVRNFLFSLSSPDAIEHHITLSSNNPDIVSVTPASVVIPPGETQVPIQVAGQQAGLGAIALSASSLVDTSVPVFVTAEFTGLTTSYATPVEVVREAAEPEPGFSASTASPLVGVHVGAYVDSVSPDAIGIGTGPTTLTIAGSGLAAATSVALVPADGVELGSPVVDASGELVSVDLTVAADAPQTMRRIVLSGPAGEYRAASPSADRILITAPAPEIDSIDPIFALPGSPSVTLTLRGSNLQQASSLAFSPGTGITVGEMPVVSADGSLLTVAVAVSPFAPAGEHVVTVTTPGGTSSAEKNAANTFRIAEEQLAIHTPITAPLVGVMRLDNPPPADAYPLYTSALGVTVGPFVERISPRAAIIGETTTLTLHGNALTDVTAVEFEPGNGLEYGTPSVSADGSSLSLSLSVAADAPLQPRRVRVVTAQGVVPFASAAEGMLDIVLPLPELASVSPVVLQQGDIAREIILRGSNLAQASRVQVIPEDGLIASPPQVIGDGAEVRFNLTVSADAAPGERVVVITTPAGSSDATPMATNTVHIVTEAAPAITPVVAPNLGVILTAPDAAAPDLPVFSPLLGVQLPSSTDGPDTISRPAYAPRLGVAIGPMLGTVQAPPLSPGMTATLLLEGIGLAAGDELVATPAEGLVFGVPEVNSDGTQLAVEVIVDEDIEVGLRSVRLHREGQPLWTASPHMATLHIDPADMSIDSISPILGYQGETVKLVIRGSGLNNAVAVLVEPNEGLSVDSHPSANALGTELTLDVHIDSDAALGSRVVQVQAQGGTSTSSEPTPANTFTVYPRD